MNVCFHSGRFVRDPELKSVGDTNVVNFSLAVVGSKNLKTGKCTFINCEAWDTGAKIICERYQKGDLITLKSEYREDEWEDKEKNKKRFPKFRVHEFAGIGSRPRVEKQNNVDKPEQENDDAPKF